jgi:hypothetical protein|tara:strand:+ start:637 stop:957 length:321 start_codon:yes stop_codon:yes gene_type:complete
LKGDYLSVVIEDKKITVRNNNNMLSSALLSGLLMISGQNIDFPEVWKKIEGKWSYVGEVKEKPQILFWIEKKTKSKSKNIVTKEIKKMPFIILTPKGEVLDIEPLQ